MHNGERMTKWHQDNLSKVNYDKYQAMVLGNPKGERNVDLDIIMWRKSRTVTIHQDPRCKPR